MLVVSVCVCVLVSRYVCVCCEQVCVCCEHVRVCVLVVSVLVVSRCVL